MAVDSSVNFTVSTTPMVIVGGGNTRAVRFNDISYLREIYKYIFY